MLIKQNNLERGQGLSEYAVILALVAIVVAVMVGVFGTELLKVYCRIVMAIDPAVDAPMCERIDVSCGASTSSGKASLEATVTDTMGEDDVERVDFYIDGKFHKPESIPKFCMGGGDASCTPVSLPSGTHTLRAVAFDAEGNSGFCEVTVNVP